MNTIDNAKDHIARARGHLSSAFEWLKQSEKAFKPMLGLATTEELLAEIKARIEVDNE